MPKQILETRDAGEVKFELEETGYVRVTVREPLAVNKSINRISIPDFLDFSARLLMATVANSRAVSAQLAKQIGDAKQ